MSRRFSVISITTEPTIANVATKAISAPISTMANFSIRRMAFTEAFFLSRVRMSNSSPAIADNSFTMCFKLLSGAILMAMPDTLSA